MTPDCHSYKKATTKLQIVSHLDWWHSSHLVRCWGKWIEHRLIQTFPLLEHARQSLCGMGMKSHWSSSNSLRVIHYNLTFIFSPFSGFITVLLPQWRDFACEGVYITQKKNPTQPLESWDHLSNHFNFGKISQMLRYLMRDVGFLVGSGFKASFKKMSLSIPLNLLAHYSIKPNSRWTSCSAGKISLANTIFSV